MERHAFDATRGGGEILLQRVARHVQDCIAEGVFMPGGKLPGERSLAAQLGLSRNTISAAYQLLESRGLICRLPYRGAFVSRPAVHASSVARAAGSSVAWSEKISRHAHLMDEPVLELLARSRLPSPRYPLSAGTPSLACFPYEEFRDATMQVLRERPRAALGIAPTEGQASLRQAIAQFDGVEANRVLVLAGAQEGIDLIARCLIEPGDTAIVDRPTYPGAIQALRSAGARLLQWEAGKWSAEELERLLIAHRPKLIFTMPTYHNPTGYSMSPEQREDLLELAGRYGVPVIEDDVYARTRFSGATFKSLRELDRQNVVIYVSTFSKIFAPGLRLGWIVAPPHMIKQLSLMKMRATLFTGGLQQLVLASMLGDGAFYRHLERLRAEHLSLRDTAVQALRRNFPADELEWLPPEGGLYLWCRSRRVQDIEPALLRAEEAGVTVAPGRAFYADRPDDACFRICFTSCEAPQLREAIAALAQAWRAA